MQHFKLLFSPGTSGPAKIRPLKVWDLPDFLSGFALWYFASVHGRVVPAVTAGAEDCRAALVISVQVRHGLQLEKVGGEMRRYARKQHLGALTNAVAASNEER